MCSKYLAVIPLFVVLLSLVVACGSNSPTPTINPQSPAEVEKTAVELFDDWLEATESRDAADVLGLCKVAERSEYAEEQDYSLNAGRYVGIALEEDNLTAEEFKALMLEKHEVLKGLNSEAHALEEAIDRNIQEVF